MGIELRIPRQTIWKKLVIIERNEINKIKYSF